MACMGQLCWTCIVFVSLTGLNAAVSVGGDAATQVRKETHVALQGRWSVSGSKT